MIREPLEHGGLVSEAASFNLLLSCCTAVWLQAAPEDPMQRVPTYGLRI
jgi:XRE family transcriptional regulator, aerobic/anaerobic benzoate catabolism transcriptional regulator